MQCRLWKCWRQGSDACGMRLLDLRNVLCILIGLFVLSCSKKEQNKERDLVTLPIKGQVISIDGIAHRITIAHEEIPNYMRAMTMPFKVKDTTLLAKVQPGDSVQGTLAVSRTESWIEALSVMGQGAAAGFLSPEEVRLKRFFREGEKLPDFKFVNQDAHRIRLSDYRGKVLALTFVYSRCPLPDFCIRMSENFAKLQKSLSKNEKLRGKWRLLTISFDPAFDTPQVLKRYGESYGADFSTWEFATDSLQTVRSLLDELDLFVQNDQSGLITHNLRTILIDPEGRLVKVIKGNEWTPTEVAVQVSQLVR